MRLLHSGAFVALLSTAQCVNLLQQQASSVLAASAAGDFGLQYREQSLRSNGSKRIVANPDGSTKGSDSKSSVSGPISSDESPTKVDKTEEIISPKNDSPGESAENDAKPKSSKSVLMDDGSADKVKSMEKVEVPFWDYEDLTQPKCINCKGLADYEWVLMEYGQVIGTKALLIILALVLIWMLGTTAQDFFVPPLLYWSEKLQLPPEMAGATLLALGNGAPDIFAVCTAAHKGDLPLALSEMLGANMFTLCVTGGVAVLSCYVHLSSQPSEESADGAAVVSLNYGDRGGLMFWTVAIYLLALLALAFVLMHGSPSILKASLLPFIYVMYLLVLRWYSGDKDTSSVTDGHPAAPCEAGDAEALPKPAPEQPTPPPLAGLTAPKEASPLQFAYWCFGLPAYIVRWFCIPPVDRQWGQFRRTMSAVAPLGMLVFCVLTNIAKMQSMSFISLIGFTLLAFLVGISIYVGSDSQQTLPWFYPALPLMALISAVLWLAVLAAEITALVEAIGFMLQVPRLRLGYTAIAWGNCLADLLVVIATIRKGHPQMAITAIFAAPLIDDCIAFGAALMLVASKKEIPVMCGANCPSEFKHPLITSLCFIVVAVLLLCGMLRNKGMHPRLWASSLIVCYVSFLVIVLFVQRVDAPEAVKAAS